MKSRNTKQFHSLLIKSLNPKQGANKHQRPSSYSEKGPSPAKGFRTESYHTAMEKQNSRHVSIHYKKHFRSHRTSSSKSPNRLTHHRSKLITLVLLSAIAKGNTRLYTVKLEDEMVHVHLVRSRGSLSNHNNNT